MKSTALLVLAIAGLFTACTSARDEVRRKAPNTVPVPHNTIVDCPVYDGMTKSSNVLTQTTAGNTVQVLDTINAYFVRVRLEKAGLVQTGYMDRRCFGVRGDK
jgi:hypothetical protein